MRVPVAVKGIISASGDDLGDHVLGSPDASGHLAGRGHLHAALHVALPRIGSSHPFLFHSPISTH